MTARRFLIVHNPVAGRRRHKFVADIVAALGDLGCLVTVQTTSGPGDAIEMARTAEDVDVVAAAGGDGPLGEAAHGLCLRDG
ncbi:MAG: acylglycerol kinase family protein, partial [Proteobacteria bacterium]|nr:acylglycerol kinase family protein [Pseudomonadota bacterium]